MIGYLPKELNGWAIRSDFRVALTIFEMYADDSIPLKYKTIAILKCFYKDFDTIPQEKYEEALKAMLWFLDGGKEYDDKIKTQKKIIDWVQDEQLIFSAVNKVANKETRELDYMHWWTFLGYFTEIGESLLSTVINIRNKKNKGKKLEKYEQEFYMKNKSLIDIKKKYSKEEEELNKLFS